MEMMLIRDDLWHVISKERPTYSSNRGLDDRGCHYGLCFDDNQTRLVMNCASAKDAWKALKEYHDKGSEVYLLKKLTRLELKEEYGATLAAIY